MGSLKLVLCLSYFISSVRHKLYNKNLMRMGENCSGYDERSVHCSHHGVTDFDELPMVRI